jgi:anti-sigma regulatory factor (Ser/Thr protein kinase)
MKIEFTVRLPVDSHSVPFARGLCRKALEHLKVDKDTVDEIALALTEACANVVEHSGQGTDYDVAVQIADDVCRISVWDEGAGFELPDPSQPVDPHADGGAGLVLMRALVDELAFERDPDGRHRVTLEKRLETRPALRLIDRE